MNGQRLFVPFAAPGDTLLLQPSGGRAVILEILTPGPDRAAPLCKHFGECGGCALQHVTDDFVARWKRQQIADALKRQGVSTDVRPTLTCPPGTRRRAAFTLERAPVGGVVQAGFRARLSHRLIALEECHVLDPAILRVLPGLARLAAPLLHAKGQARMAVNLTRTGLDVSAVMDRASALTLSQLTHLAEMADTLDLARLAWNGEIVVARRNPQVNFAGVAVLPPPGAFMQASPEGEAALVSLVMEALGNETGRETGRALELFAGCGTFTFPAARYCAVDAVEGDAAMAAALRHAAANAVGVKPVTVSTRDLFKRPLMPNELASYSTIIFDPPETGAEVQALQISATPAAKSKLKRVIGISCDASSFARDARILADGGFALQWVAPVDQFRWSARIELAALFER